MPTMHGPFVQLSSSLGVFAAHVLFALAPAASSEDVGLDFSVRHLFAQCHAPPIFCSPASAPLRI